MANVARGACRPEIPAAIRGQLGDRTVCHPSEQITFILNMYLAVVRPAGHNCIRAAPEFMEPHTGYAKDPFWLFL
jgi:hypothetical protein